MATIASNDMVLSEVHASQKRAESERSITKQCPNSDTKTYLTRFPFKITSKNNDGDPGVLEKTYIGYIECFEDKTKSKTEANKALLESECAAPDGDGDIDVCRRASRHSKTPGNDIFPQKDITQCQEKNEESFSLNSNDQFGFGSSNEVLIIEHKMETDIEDVGCQVWSGALLLCDYLISKRETLRAKKVLDLGAGTGITSVVAAMFAELVICTDYSPEVLSLAQRNWERNKDLLPEKLCDDLQFCKLDWREYWNCYSLFDTDREKIPCSLDVKSLKTLSSVDVILGAEVIYDEELTDDLFRTVYLIMAAQPEKTLLISLEKRIIFSSDTHTLRSPSYERFRENLKDLETVDEGNLRFHLRQIDTSFTKSFHYERHKHLELWEVKSRFVTE